MTLVVQSQYSNGRYTLKRKLAFDGIPSIIVEHIAISFSQYRGNYDKRQGKNGQSLELIGCEQHGAKWFINCTKTVSWS